MANGKSRAVRRIEERRIFQSFLLYPEIVLLCSRFHMGKPSEPKLSSSPMPVSFISPTPDDASGLASRSLVALRAEAELPGSRISKSESGRLRSSQIGKSGESETAGSIFAKSLWARWRRYRARLRDCRKELSADSLHQLRVATRRLLTFVLLLEPLTQPAPERKARKVLKRRLKYLGKLRDAQIQRIETALGRRQFPRLAIAEQKLAHREARLIKDALGKIQNFKMRKLQMIFEIMRGDLQSQAGRDEEILARVRRSAQEAFDEVVRRRMTIDAAQAETIHRTRVAFKKFRYIVEGLSPTFTGLSRTELQPLSDFQTSMGDIQDLEITESWLSEFIQDHPSEAAGVQPFLTHLRRRKLALQKAFVKTADRLFEFWPIPRLDSVIRQRSAPPVLRFGVQESGSVSFLGTGDRL